MRPTRRDTFTGQLLTFPASDNSERSIVYSVLSNLADGLDAQLFLKEQGDDLLGWPLGAIVGATPRIAAAQACPARLEIRRRDSHFEFVVPDDLLIGAFCLLANARGLPFGKPIHPSAFPAHSLFEDPDGGWVSILPSSWGQAVLARDGVPH